MIEPRLEFVSCASPSGIHRMAYWEWGDADNDKVLICVHGLTRCGRDFDEVAQRLAPSHRVVCPDIVGRGRSDWLADPMGYSVPQYISDILTLIARLDVDEVDWLGTSMGGLIGLGLAGALAAAPLQRPRRGSFGLPADRTLRLGRIALNDIGPRLDRQGLARIAGYVGRDLSFDTFDEAVAYVQSVSAGFGPHSQAQWNRLTRDVFNQEDGRWVRHYDLRFAWPNPWRSRTRRRWRRPSGCCGRPMTASPRPSWCCGAASRTCCRKTPRARCWRATPAPGWSSSRASAMLRLCWPMNR